MHVELVDWRDIASAGVDSGAVRADRRLVLAFGARERLAAEWASIRGRYEGAVVLGCSTAGEILGTSVSDDSIAVAVTDFDATDLRAASTVLCEADGGSRGAGTRLARTLEGEGLRHVFVLSDGLNVNGSELVAGLVGELGAGVTVTGGLAGDGSLFAETSVGVGAEIGSGLVAAVGLYGPSIQVSSASLGGWDPFGPERVVTSSSGNVVFELDHQPALELYTRYLGEHAAELPGSALLFPLSVRIDGEGEPVVRTILGVDERTQSMTFAGNVPQGSLARLMKANFDRLIEGAAGAARAASKVSGSPELAILISCVGRKLVLKQRIEEEVEGVRDVVGPDTALVGFYSYGEISPFTPSARCELHNQTMTITTLSEAA